MPSGAYKSSVKVFFKELLKKRLMSLLRVHALYEQHTHEPMQFLPAAHSVNLCD